MNLPDKRQNKLRIILPLLAIAPVCALLLFVAHELTQEKIRINTGIFELRIIEAVMPLPHDNALYEDSIEISDPDLAGHGRPVTVFRARRDNQPVGVVFNPVMAKGYSGNIELTIGIAFDGTLTGVRVLKHHETEGLGDRIDHTQSDWIQLFTGRSLENTPMEAWTTTADGGQFDALSGATITSRAVIEAVRKTVGYYQANRAKLF